MRLRNIDLAKSTSQCCLLIIEGLADLYSPEDIAQQTASFMTLTYPHETGVTDSIDARLQFCYEEA